MDSSILNKRLKANDLARRLCSDVFCDETYGHTPLDSVAPFERDEIVIGKRVGSGAFSFVYEIQALNLRPDQTDVYTDEQIDKREKIVMSMKTGAKYVMKCLKDELEHSDDEDLFLDAAMDIAHEAEMLAALSHPNIIQLHGVVASRHDAFLDGASSFFIILERLESTLADEIEDWTKEKDVFNLSSSLKSLSNGLSSIKSRSRSSSHSSSGALDTLEKASGLGASKGRSLENRLRVAINLAGAVEYLHSEGVIFHDLKRGNVGFDRQGNLKLFDFGLARFMPQNGDAYTDVYEMSGAGTPRYSAPEVFFEKPYNLKADVYSFAVMLWEIMSLKKPFAKCKHRKEFQKALQKVDKTLAIDRRWPQPIQDLLRKSLSDHSVRPTMSEVRQVLDECASIGIEASDIESTDVSMTRCKSAGVLSQLSPRRDNQRMRRYSFSSTAAVPVQDGYKYKRHLSEVSGATVSTIEDFSFQDVETRDDSLHSLEETLLEI